VNSEVKVGILFFLGLGLLLWFTIFTTQLGQTKGAYAVRFPRVTRLKEGDAVTFNGVRVGTITEVAPVLGADGRPLVQVSFSLNSDRQKMVLIDERTEFKISQGLLGGSAMDISSRSGSPITPDALKGRMGKEPAGIDEALASLQSMIEENRAGLKEAIGSVKDNLDRFGRMSTQIEDLVKENRAEIATAITNFGAMSGRISTLVDENREGVKQAVGRFSEMSDQITQLVKENRESIKAATERLPAAVDSVRSAMKSFGDAVEENRAGLKTAVDNIAKATPKLEHVADNLDVITTQIASGRGTVGKLVFEDTLHDKAVATIDSFNQRLEEIKPVTRGFSDLKLYLGVDGGEDTRTGAGVYGAYLRIEPAPWKFYQGGVSYRTAPSDRDTFKDDPNKLNVDINLLVGWRWFPDDDAQVYRLSAAAGLVDSEIGGVASVLLFPNLTLDVMARKKDNQRDPLDRRYEHGGAMVRAMLTYRIWDRVSLSVGGDDLAGHPGPWIGLRAELLDNDLRNLTSVSSLVK
jgi:phospholipid/cholesterol/gamma-HCH transport system substrate-binding protein